MTKVKLCGLSRPEDILAVNEALPDYIGFVFAESRRRISDKTAAQLKEQLDPRIQTVGVFVNERLETVLRLSDSNLLDILQLHGDETEDYIRALKQSVKQPVIKAVRVSGANDLISAERLPCDYLLLDTYHKEQYGGSGISFDWSVVHGISKPFFLAGGMNRDNVKEAIHRLSPYCIDISSGVETDQVKDREKMIEIVTKVRSV